MLIVKLKLTDGSETLVDKDVASEIKFLKIYPIIVGRTSTKYAQIFKDKRSQSLHRFIMKAPKGMCVDHINGNSLDNRRSNLRIVTQSENLLNWRTEPRSKSGYRSVYTTRCISWRVQLVYYGKILSLGHFKSRHVAAVFADQLIVKVVGPFVKKNFAEKITSSFLSDFLESTSGKIFRIVFSRRSDGKQREMVCRTGVNSRHNNGTIPFDPSSMNLFSVYDVHKRAYRFIPLENVICIRFAKKNYRVVA